MTSILSGLYLSQHRRWTFGKGFPSRIPSLPQLLRRAHYTTGFFTANHAIGEGYGMEDHFDHVEFQAAKENDFGPRLTDDCMSWIEEVGSDPIFAYVHFFPPHGPYNPPEAYGSATSPVGSSESSEELEISLGDGASGRIPWYQAKANFSRHPSTYLRAYDANVRYADSLLADFVDRWQQRRGGKRTVFIITSDHGECLEEYHRFFDHGRVLANQILHVPLLFFDTALAKGSVVNEPVSHLDLGNTVLHLAESSEQLGQHGIDLLQRQEGQRTLISQVGLGRGHDGGWALTRERWRLTYNDFPLDGLAAINAVVAGRRRDNIRCLPFPRPDTELASPISLSTDVVLSQLALDSAHMVAGTPRLVKGRLENPRGNHLPGGALELRCTVEGRAPLPLQECAIDPATKSFTVELPGVPVHHADGTPYVSLEARWSGSAPGRWVPTLSTPLLSPRRLDGGVHLLGVALDRRVARPGDHVRVTYVWELEEIPPRDLGIFGHFRLADGPTVFRNDHLFFNENLEEAAANRRTLNPLIDPWRIRQNSLEGRSFRFDETFWVAVPADAVPGTYEVVVGLFDFSGYDPARPDHYPDQRSALVAQKLTVVTTRRDVIRETLTRDRCGVLCLLNDEGPAIEALETDELQELASRFPDQGHLLYLLSRRSTGIDREALIRSCIERTPFHRLALAEAARRGGELAKRHETLTPAVRTDILFAPGIRLFGLDIVRASSGPAPIYVSFYWECLAPSNHAYSGNLYGRVSLPPPAEAVGASSWWFLGGRVRPTPDWCVGEAIVETVRLDTLPAGGELMLKLSLNERWNYVYSNSKKLKPVPIVSQSLSQESDSALLGRFQLADLPVAEADPIHHRRHDESQFQLYDLISDPEETTNFIARQPAVFNELHQELLQLIEACDLSENTDDEPDDQELSEETRQRLEALGYVI